MSNQGKDKHNPKLEATGVAPEEVSTQADALDEDLGSADGEEEDLTDEQLEALEAEWVDEAVEQLGEIEEHVLIKALNRYLREYDLDSGLAHEYARVVAAISERLADMVLLESGEEDEEDEEDAVE